MPVRKPGLTLPPRYPRQTSLSSIKLRRGTGRGGTFRSESKINFTWSDRLSAQIAADLPVSINSSGQQIVPDYRVRAALTWRF